MIGQTPRLLKSGATTANEYRQLWKTILSGKEWRGTLHNRRKDGRLYWERASISPVLDVEGKIAHFMAVKEDITGFMESEQAVRRDSCDVWRDPRCIAVCGAGPGCANENSVCQWRRRTAAGRRTPARHTV